MTEHDEQAMLFEWTRYRPELRWMFAIPNGGLRNKVTAARLRSEGTKAGVWDIFLPIPSKGYHGMFLEMKFGKNRLTENQKEFGEFVNGKGYYTAVAYSADEAMREIDQYLDANDAD